MLRRLVVAVLVVASVAVAVGFVTGVGPAPGGGSGDDIESFPTETASAASDDGATTTETADRPFTFTVDDVQECGQTCRDVTTTLTNAQASDASGVTVYTRIYAGNGTEGDVVWAGTEDVGTLGAGESYTTTERVELSLSDAYAVQRADGWITVQTTVESDGETMTVTDRKQVA